MLFGSSKLKHSQLEAPSPGSIKWLYLSGPIGATHQIRNCPRSCSVWPAHKATQVAGLLLQIYCLAPWAPAHSQNPTNTLTFGQLLNWCFLPEISGCVAAPLYPVQHQTDNPEPWSRDWEINRELLSLSVSLPVCQPKQFPSPTPQTKSKARLKSIISFIQESLMVSGQHELRYPKGMLEISP